MNAKTSQAFFEAQTRMDAILCVAMSLVDHDALPDLFVDQFASWFLDHGPEDADIKDLLPALPGIDELLENDFADTTSEDLAEWLGNKGHLGFLAQVSAPVRDYFDENGWTSSWGYTHFTWLYADTIGQLAERALAWSTDMANLDKRKKG